MYPCSICVQIIKPDRSLHQTSLVKFFWESKGGSKMFTLIFYPYRLLIYQQTCTYILQMRVVLTCMSVGHIGDTQDAIQYILEYNSVFIIARHTRVVLSRMSMDYESGSPMRHGGPECSLRCKKQDGRNSRYPISQGEMNKKNRWGGEKLSLFNIRYIDICILLLILVHYI